MKTRGQRQIHSRSQSSVMIVTLDGLISCRDAQAEEHELRKKAYKHADKAENRTFAGVGMIIGGIFLVPATFGASLLMCGAGGRVLVAADYHEQKQV